MVQPWTSLILATCVSAPRNTHVAFRSPDRALSRHEHVLTIMLFTSDIVVMAINYLRRRFERRDLAGSLNCPQNCIHHQLPIPSCVVLCPSDGLDIVVKVFRVFRKVCEILIRQVDKELLHVALGEFNEVCANAISNAS